MLNELYDVLVINISNFLRTSLTYECLQFTNFAKYSSIILIVCVSFCLNSWYLVLISSKLASSLKEERYSANLSQGTYGWVVETLYIWNWNCYIWYLRINIFHFYMNNLKFFFSIYFVVEFVFLWIYRRKYVNKEITML